MTNAKTRKAVYAPGSRNASWRIFLPEPMNLATKLVMVVCLSTLPACEAKETLPAPSQRQTAESGLSAKRNEAKTPNAGMDCAGSLSNRPIKSLNNQELWVEYRRSTLCSLDQSSRAVLEELALRQDEEAEYDLALRLHYSRTDSERIRAIGLLKQSARAGYAPAVRDLKTLKQSGDF